MAFDADEPLPQLNQIASRYADRSPDFADLCLVRMSELQTKHSVITVMVTSAFIAATSAM
ncbi:MAG: hypothetical protein NTX35_08470 [Verrucomicrobia bacterium]|nr:hypothetical protein [Verrucomicrobiota bacterium]